MQYTSYLEFNKFDFIRFNRIDSIDRSYKDSEGQQLEFYEKNGPFCRPYVFEHRVDA